jgi:hypothetical protein
VSIDEPPASIDTEVAVRLTEGATAVTDTVTTADPLVAVDEVQPLLAQLDAFVELHVRVEEPPSVIEAGLAARVVATGSGTDVGAPEHAKLDPATATTTTKKW